MINLNNRAGRLVTASWQATTKNLCIGDIFLTPVAQSLYDHYQAQYMEFDGRVHPAVVILKADKVGELKLGVGSMRRY